MLHKTLTINQFICYLRGALGADLYTYKLSKLQNINGAKEQFNSNDNQISVVKNIDMNKGRYGYTSMIPHLITTKKSKSLSS